MSGHSPGPWVVETVGNHVTVVDDGGRGRDVCVVGLLGVGDNVAEDGALIAAAPDLYTALCDLVDLVEGDEEATTPGTFLWAAVWAAKAARDRAKGETR